VLNWLVNKITDPHGNYMTFTYESLDGEIWIRRIDYTGNAAANLSPFARVEFEYSSAFRHHGSDFVAGHEIKQTKLLSKISVRYNENGYADVRRYEFEYLGSYPPRLGAIRLYGSDGKCLRPTTVQWGDTRNGAFVEEKHELGVTRGCRFLSADLNGDKYSDLIEIDGNIWRVYANSGGNYTRLPNVHAPQLALHYRWHDVVIADLDGDGKDEVLSAYFSQYDRRFKITHSRLTNSNAIETANYYEEINYTGRFIIKSGYFSGKGKAELLFWMDDKIKIYGGGVSSSLPLPNHYAVTLVDFNGNGKTDILAMDVNASRYVVYEYDTERNAFDKIAEKTNHRIGSSAPFAGDFNGDGISDLLWRASGNSYKIALGTGNGFAPEQSVSFSHTSSSSPMICDINGDGKDDFMGFYGTGALFANCYLSKGHHSGQVNFSTLLPYKLLDSDGYSLVSGDFNGDHALDFIAVCRSCATDHLHLFKGDLQEELVKRVTNGFGVPVDIVYKPFYAYGVDHASFRRQTVSFHLPETVKTPTGFLNNDKVISHEFSNPVISHARGAFLGFLNHGAFDNAAREKTNLVFSKDNVKEMIVPFEKTVVKSGTFLEERRYAHAVKDLLGGNFVPYVSLETVDDKLAGSILKTERTLDFTGRESSVSATVSPYNSTGFLTRETTEYAYANVTLPNSAVCTRLASSVTKSYLNNSALHMDRTTLYRYSGGRLASLVETDAEGSVTTAFGNYDPFGNAKTVTVSASNLATRTETTTFDATGRFVTRHANPLSQASLFSHDPRTGNPLSSTDINGLTTTFGYDGFGKEKSRQYPDGTRTDTYFSWNTSPNTFPGDYEVRIYRTGKYTRIAYYDKLGREVCRKADANSYVDTRYDHKGRVGRTSLPYAGISSGDSEKLWTNYTYDQLDRVTGEYSPLSDISYTYSTNSVTARDNRRGVSSAKTSDAAGRVVSVTDAGGTMAYSYSHVNIGGKVRVKQEIGLHGNTTAVVSDSRGNRLSIEEPNAGAVTSGYNAYGELASQTDANGNTAYFTYDKLGRVTKEVLSKPGEASVTTAYYYDGWSQSRRGRGANQAGNGERSEQKNFHLRRPGTFGRRERPH
jgi:YD repeat-containing protein